MSGAGFRSVDSEVTWRGTVVTAGVAHYRHADGTLKQAAWELMAARPEPPRGAGRRA